MTQRSVRRERRRPGLGEARRYATAVTAPRHGTSRAARPRSLRPCACPRDALDATRAEARAQHPRRDLLQRHVVDARRRRSCRACLGRLSAPGSRRPSQPSRSEPDSHVDSPGGLRPWTVNEPVDAGGPLLAAAERRRPHATRTLAAPCTRAAARRGMRPRRLVPSVASARPGIAQGMRGPAARAPGSSRFRHTTSVGTRTLTAGGRPRLERPRLTLTRLGAVVLEIPCEHPLSDVRGDPMRSLTGAPRADLAVQCLYLFCALSNRRRRRMSSSRYWPSSSRNCQNVQPFVWGYSRSGNGPATVTRATPAAVDSDSYRLPWNAT